MVGVEVRRLASLAAGIALIVACAHEDVDDPTDSEPVEPGLEELESEGTGGECAAVDEEGIEGFDYVVSSPDGAFRIEFRESDFGHKMVRAVEQRPDGSTRDLRYRSPEEELVIVESVRGEDPVRTVHTGDEAMNHPDAGWLGEVLMQARAICEPRVGDDPSTGP